MGRAVGPRGAEVVDLDRDHGDAVVLAGRAAGELEAGRRHGADVDQLAVDQHVTCAGRAGRRLGADPVVAVEGDPLGATQVDQAAAALHHDVVYDEAVFVSGGGVQVDRLVDRLHQGVVGDHHVLHARGVGGLAPVDALLAAGDDVVGDHAGGRRAAAAQALEVDPQGAQAVLAVALLARAVAEVAADDHVGGVDHRDVVGDVVVDQVLAGGDVGALDDGDAVAVVVVDLVVEYLNVGAGLDQRAAGPQPPEVGVGAHVVGDGVAADGAAGGVGVADGVVQTALDGVALDVVAGARRGHAVPLGVLDLHPLEGDVIAQQLHHAGVVGGRQGVVETVDEHLGAGGGLDQHRLGRGALGADRQLLGVGAGVDQQGVAGGQLGGVLEGLPGGRRAAVAAVVAGGGDVVGGGQRGRREQQRGQQGDRAEGADHGLPLV